MPIKNQLAEMHSEIMYDTHCTSGKVADKLCEFGCDEVVSGIGRTGVVGIIRGRGDTRVHVVGLRADMARCQSLKHLVRSTLAKPPARCMPAGTMGTRPCCSVPRSTYPRREISTALSRSFSSPPKGVVPVEKQWSKTV